MAIKKGRLEVEFIDLSEATPEDRVLITLDNGDVFSLSVSERESGLLTVNFNESDEVAVRRLVDQTVSSLASRGRAQRVYSRHLDPSDVRKLILAEIEGSVYIDVPNAEGQIDDEGMPRAGRLLEFREQLDGRRYFEFQTVGMIATIEYAMINDQQRFPVVQPWQNTNAPVVAPLSTGPATDELASSAGSE